MNAYQASDLTVAESPGDYEIFNIKGVLIGKQIKSKIVVNQKGKFFGKTFLLKVPLGYYNGKGECHVRCRRNSSGCIWQYLGIRVKGIKKEYSHQKQRDGKQRNQKE